MKYDTSYYYRLIEDRQFVEHALLREIPADENWKPGQKDRWLAARHAVSELFDYQLAEAVDALTRRPSVGDRYC